jgi:HD-GYP domain-containing protein (c-di-GMP phosphodiesterase class II)
MVRVHGGHHVLDLKSAADRGFAPLRSGRVRRGGMVETRREMSTKLSEPRPNLYDRIRGSLRKSLVGSRARELETLKEATIELAAQALDARDLAIASHCARVAELAARLAQQFDLGRRNVELTRMAGRLHDLGMIGVRDDILNKLGPLREDEWEILRRHPDIGADMIRWHPALAVVAPLVHHHHERLDGSGYPAGLKGEVIPMGARIIAVAESFDFITNKWPYRANPSTAVDAIRDISEHSGSWYDPAVLDALRALYR